MRALLTKALTGSMIAGAALLVSACGGSTTNTTENTVITDLNATDATMDGTMSDNMTPVDGAMGNDMMMSNDTMMANDTMMMSNTTTTTNAM
ncbi:hypothetical protein [uncultured Sphingomonas sp.]|uniref:hypothetical protein n=1 Tax=uncultured Sphingomonas sp. TaxID=158754 RepID=UPI0025FE6AE9|nr:hypothetical protein [uncultured Sphingomonas sp.]